MIACPGRPANGGARRKVAGEKKAADGDEVDRQVDQDRYARRNAHPQSAVCVVKNPSAILRAQVDAVLALQFVEGRC
jgi:hypothetical protein